MSESRQPPDLGGGIAARPWGATLHIVVDGADPSATSDVVHHLASANGATVERVVGAIDETPLDWFGYAAGSFDGNPLRLEVFAPGAAAEPATRRRLVEECDALVVVARPGDASTAAGQTFVRGLIGGDGESVAAPWVLFADRRDPDAAFDPIDVRRALGVGDEVPVVATDVGGAGIRYGMAMAVRLGLQRMRERGPGSFAVAGCSGPEWVTAVLAPEEPAGASEEPAETVAAETVAAAEVEVAADDPGGGDHGDVEEAEADAVLDLTLAEVDRPDDSTEDIDGFPYDDGEEGDDALLLALQGAIDDVDLRLDDDDDEEGLADDELAETGGSSWFDVMLGREDQPGSAASGKLALATPAEPGSADLLGAGPAPAFVGRAEPSLVRQSKRRKAYVLAALVVAALTAVAVGTSGQLRSTTPASVPAVPAVHS